MDELKPAAARPIKLGEVLDLIARLTRGGPAAGGTGLLADIALPVLRRITEAHSGAPTLPLSSGLAIATIARPHDAARKGARMKNRFGPVTLNAFPIFHKDGAPLLAGDLKSGQFIDVAIDRAGGAARLASDPRPNRAARRKAKAKERKAGYTHGRL